MNCYATNDTDKGYEFQGSFNDLEEAQLWARLHAMRFSHWWADVAYPESNGPVWVRYPA